jgi:ABC-type nitrate/sulfonate/bicarbonate transport system permease component
LWKATGDTLAVFFLTEIAVVIVGFLLAWLLYASKTATAWLEPVIQIMRPIPSIATIAIGAMLLTSSSAFLGVLVAFIGSLWPFTIAVLDTFRRVPVALRESTLTLGKGKRRFYGQVLILASLPGLFSAVRLVAPITLLLTVTTQYFYQHLGGLGALLLEKHYGLAYPKVISIIIMLSLIGIAIEWGLRHLEHWVCKWRVEPTE